MGEKKVCLRQVKGGKYIYLTEEEQKNTIKCMVKP